MQHTGLFYALAATVMYSLKPILIKLIYVYEVSSLDILAWRMIISLPIYILVGIFVWNKIRLRKRQNLQKVKNQPKWIIKTMLIGVIGYYLAALLDLLGLQFITAQLARLILFTYPALVALLGWFIFKHEIRPPVILALFLSYIGVGFIFWDDLNILGSQVIFGSIIMFLSAVSFALYVLLSKPIIDQVGGTVFTVVAMVSSCLCILAHFIVTSHSLGDLIVPGKAFWLIFLMTILTTVIPSFLIAEAIARIGPQKTAISGSVGPATTSIFAVIFLGEAFGLSHLAGIILVVLAVFFMQRDRIFRPSDSI